MRANRRLYEEGDKCILHSFQFMPQETPPQDKLKIIFESVLAGDTHAVGLLKGQARNGSDWAIYGLERLVDAGLETGKKTLDEIVLLKKMVDGGLWRYHDFSWKLEEHLDEAKMLLPKEVVLLCLLPTELRNVLEHEFLMTCQGHENPFEYMQDFLDHLFQMFQGELMDSEDLQGTLKRVVLKSLHEFIIAPGSLRLQISVASFLDKVKELLKIEEGGMLEEWAFETLQRKRDLQ